MNNTTLDSDDGFGKVEIFPYRITYFTADGKQLKYNELVKDTSAESALFVADLRYKARRPKTAATRKIRKVNFHLVEPSQNNLSEV